MKLKDVRGIDRNFLKIAGFDALFYLLAIVVIGAIFLLIQSKTSAMDTGILNQDILNQPVDRIEALNSQIKSLAVLLVTVIILALAALIAAWSFSRGLIFTKILKKKLSGKYFKKLCLLNLIFGLLIITLILGFSKFVEVPYIPYIFLAIFLTLSFFINIVYTEFTKENKIFEAIGKGLSLGAPTYAFLILAGIVFYAVYAIIKSLIFLPLYPFLAVYIIAIGVIVTLAKTPILKQIDKYKLLFPTIAILFAFILTSILNYFLLKLIPTQLLSLVILILFAAWARPYFVENIK